MSTHVHVGTEESLLRLCRRGTTRHALEPREDAHLAGGAYAGPMAFNADLANELLNARGRDTARFFAGREAEID